MSAKNDQGSSKSGMTRKERRAAERAARKGGTSAPSQKKSSGPSMAVITGAAVVIGIIAVVALIAMSGGLGGNEVAAVERPEVPAPAEELRHGRSLGDPDAAVIVDVFEDPQCPACALFTERIEPLLIAGPVTDGEVFFTYKDMAFLGPESFEAAAAMRVAEAMDDKFWDYHQALFHNQSGENDGAFTLERLADIAELVGLDRETFLAEMDKPEYRAAVEAETEEASTLGVNSTPSLIVAGEVMRGVPTWEDLSDRIQSAASGESEAS